MKKILFVAAGLFLCALTIQNIANAASLSQPNVGGPVTVSATNVSGAKSIVFTPSSNVVMTGVSEKTSWALGAYHTQAMNKKNGQGYGMAADSNKVWFQDISSATTLSITTTTAAAAFGSPWNSM